MEINPSNNPHKRPSNIHKNKGSNKITGTQYESWNLYRDSPKRQAHEQKVLKYLTDHEANNLQLSKALRLAINVITRATNTLRQNGLIVITSIKPCFITGQKTQHYSRCINSPQPEQSDLLNTSPIESGE